MKWNHNYEKRRKKNCIDEHKKRPYLLYSCGVIIINAVVGFSLSILNQKQLMQKIA